MGIKVGTCDEQRVLYVSDASQNSTLETNIMLYVNCYLYLFIIVIETGISIKTRKKKKRPAISSLGHI